MYIINFNTIRYKLSASGNFDHSILNYKFMRLVSSSPKEQKNRKKQQIQEKN